MEKLIYKLTLLFALVTITEMYSQVPSGYLIFKEYNFGTSNTYNSHTKLNEDFYPGLARGRSVDDYPFSHEGEWQAFQHFFDSNGQPNTNNFVFTNNSLKIIAKFDNDTNGNGKPDFIEANRNNRTREISSGSLRTKDQYIPNATTSYYFETKMKVPAGKGLWPAFWVYRYLGGGGVASEIDVLEIVNRESEVMDATAGDWRPAIFHHNLHTYNATQKGPFNSTTKWPISDTFNTWGCEWTTTQVAFYLNGSEIIRYNYPLEDKQNGWGNANPAQVLVNLAAGYTKDGGILGWPQEANDPKAFPAVLEVNYIKVYSKGSGGTGTSDKIANVSAPLSVNQGQTVNFTIDYEATTSKTITCAFQQNIPPYNDYGTTQKIKVVAGTGSIDIGMTIPSSATFGNNYQFQTHIGDGTWSGKDHKLTKSPVQVTNGSGSTSYRYLKYAIKDASSYKISELSWLVSTTNYPQTNLTTNISEPGLIATGSQRFTSNAYEAFDGITGDTGPWVGTSKTQFITLDFGSNAIAPTAIIIDKTQWGKLKRFTCEGSNDGTNWTLLLDQTITNHNWTNQTFQFSVNPSARTGSSPEQTNIDQSFIFPNPSNGIFNLNYNSRYKGEIFIEIFTINGKLINTMYLSKRNGMFSHQIDVSKQASGVYIIKLKAGDYKSSHQIIKN